MSLRGKLKKILGPAQILNHSSKSLLVIENSSSTQPIAHILGPKCKTPKGIDADGFKRLDGKTIFRHKDWWKLFDGASVDIWQLGVDLLIPTSMMVPVSDDHFGKYRIDRSSGWGQKMQYVTGRIKNRRGKVIGYQVEGMGPISKNEAIRLARSGDFDNVDVAKTKGGTVYLRTKRNMTTMDNLSA